MLAIPGTAIPGTAFADPAPIGNAHFTRGGAPLFAYPIPGAPAVFFTEYAGAAVAAVCTTGPLVQVEGFFDLDRRGERGDPLGADGRRAGTGRHRRLLTSAADTRGAIVAVRGRPVLRSRTN